MDRERAHLQVGMTSTLVAFPEDASTRELERALATLNADATCDGIVVPSPASDRKQE